MTEQEWLDGEQVGRLIAYIETEGRERQLRLFSLACCRRIEHLLVDERSRAALVALEDYAEGKLPEAELERYHSLAREAVTEIERPLYDGDGILNVNAQSCAACAVLCSVSPCIVPTLYRNWTESAVGSVASYAQMAMGAEKDESQRQSQLLRDIIGNPFRPPPALAPAWLTPEVLAAAHAAYEQRTLLLEPKRLEELAAALERVRCNDEAVLTHLKTAGPHVRGCFALDLILGKS